MDSSSALPRMSDFAYRRRNKKFFDDKSEQQATSSCSDSGGASTEIGSSANFCLTATNTTSAAQDAPSADLATQISSQKPKMLELIGEVSIRWNNQMKKSVATPSSGSALPNNDELENGTKDFAISDDEDEADNGAGKRNKLNDTAADIFESDNSAEGRERKKRKKRESDSDYAESENCGDEEENVGRGSDFDDDDECYISSANSSDSEKKEWLNKARMMEQRRNAKKRRQLAAGVVPDFYSSIKRRRDNRADEEEDAVRLLKSKNSLEMLKNLRKMRQNKNLADCEQSDDQLPQTSADITKKTNSLQFSPFSKDPDDSSINCLPSNSEKIIDSTNESIDSDIHDDTPITVNRKRLVLDSDSSDNDEKNVDSDARKITNGNANIDLKKSVDHLNCEISLNNRTTRDSSKLAENSEDSAQSVDSSESDCGPCDETGDGGKAAKIRRSVLISSEEECEENEIMPDSQHADEPSQKGAEFTQQKIVKKKTRKLSVNDVQKNTVEFFNAATIDELSSVPRCSARVAEILISLRPFKLYTDLLDSVKEAHVKGLSVALVEGYAQMLKCQNELDQLLHSCEKISQDLIKSVQDLQEGRGNQWLVTQPKLLEPSMQLKPYQLLGLNWLILMYNKDLNCILADEMGLGKTIQVIAFLAYLKELKAPGPHLIVVPSSTMDNWLCEFNRWCPDINVLTYYGSLEDRKFLRCDMADKRHLNFDVLLSTYRVVTSCSDDRAFLKRLNLHYAIFDEAHMLKNCTTHRYKSLMKIRAQRRLLLTGTPLQNNLVEFISLMHFVMPDLFFNHTENLRDLLQLFQCKIKSMVEYEKDKIEQAKSIMKPVVLRRLKCEVLDQLPKKHEFVEFCELADCQLELYGALVSECAAALKNQGAEKLADGQKTSTILSNNQARRYLMQLRKAANHPLLLRKHYTDEKIAKMAKTLCKEKSHRDANPLLVIEDMSVMSDFELTRMCKKYRSLSKFKLPTKLISASAKFRSLDKLLLEAKQDNNKVLLFSQFTMVLDIMEEYLHQRKYKYLRLDGSTPVVERQVLIDDFNSNDNLFIFLLSTKAGGLGINLTSANVIILHDIDYNPYNDRQAEDRCHRVGQTKEVKVIRLIAKNTIDESMLACARKKLELEKQLTSIDEEESEDAADMETLLKQALMI